MRKFVRAAHWFNWILFYPRSRYTEKFFNSVNLGSFFFFKVGAREMLRGNWKAKESFLNSSDFICL